MTRRMQIKAVDGLADVLTAMVLTTPTSRMVEPSREQQEMVMVLGSAFIGKAATDPANEGATVYAAYQWPETGPATLAYVWAVNTRYPVEQGTDKPFFFRTFTETKDDQDGLLTRNQMEHELALYSLQQFGKPTAV